MLGLARVLLNGQNAANGLYCTDTCGGVYQMLTRGS